MNQILAQHIKKLSFKRNERNEWYSTVGKSDLDIFTMLGYTLSMTEHVQDSELNIWTKLISIPMIYTRLFNSSFSPRDCDYLNQTEKEI